MKQEKKTLGQKERKIMRRERLEEKI